jgi:hypothetical protein
MERVSQNVLPLVRIALDIIFAIASALGWRTRWLSKPTSPEEPMETQDVPVAESGRQTKRK